jgi:hypothetical protein
MPRFNRTPFLLAMAGAILLPAATLRAQTVHPSGATSPPAAAEAVDMGLFEWTDGHAPGALGGTLVRVTRAGVNDYLLVVWYGGRSSVMLTAGEPMIVLADDDTLHASNLGRVERDAEPGAQTIETTAYRFTSLELRRLALAGNISFSIRAGESVLDCEFTAENMHMLRLFVNDLVRSADGDRGLPLSR